MTYIADRLAAFARKDDGSVAVIFAIALVVLIGAAGVAIDFARALHAHSKMQNALDSAVLAGVRAEQGSQVAVAQKMFNTNFTEKSTKNVSMSFTPVGESELSGTASGRIDTTLAGVLGINQLKINVASKAKGTGGGVVCILVLNKTAQQAFLVNSGPDVDADCELHVKSTASPAAIFNAGSTILTKRICIAGKTIIDNGGTHPNLEKECITASDPFAGKLPVPSSATCTYSNLNFNGGNVTLNPGVYCGWVNFNNNPNVTFKPGVYVIKNGGWNVTGKWTGTDVTFYFADTSKIQFNSGVTINIKAPTSGTYKNLVIYEKSGLSASQLPLNNSPDFNLEGIMYLPSREVVFNSGSRLKGKVTVVVDKLILNQTTWDITPASDEILSSGGIKSVYLIE